MKRIKNLILLWSIMMIFCLNTYGQHTLPDFTSEDADTLTWNDKHGTRLLLLSQSELKKGNEDGTFSRFIKATHWLKKEGKLYEIWSVDDEIHDCSLDIEAKFLAAPRFSDLNQNGIWEIWFITQKACKGDIRPSIVEVKMVDEKNKIFTLHAEQKLIFPNGDTAHGSYEFDAFFKELDPVYRDFALEYLKEYYAEKFE